jgi:hypothetical protein
MRQSICINELVRLVSSSKDPNVLLLVCVDESTPAKIVRKARHKLFTMWAEKTENIIRHQKSKATREANKELKIKLLLAQELEKQSIQEAAIRAAQVEREHRAKGTWITPDWQRSLSL